MTQDSLLLWEKIEQFELDDPLSTFPFSERLARENGWNLEYTLRAIFEYKRFMFLACVAGHSVTPSDEVDQVWHLHLLYSYSYWVEFCQDTLGKQIHHGPTKGGEKESDKFTDWYAKTKDSYQKFFGEKPPEDIWPASDIRFRKTNFQRLDLNRYWIIKKLF